MKLSGWQRLWIVACGIYFALAATYVVMQFPQPADVPHTDDLYRQLKPESYRKIAVVSEFGETGEWRNDPVVRENPKTGRNPFDQFDKPAPSGGWRSAPVIDSTSTASDQAPSKSAKFAFLSLDGATYVVTGPPGSTVEQAFGILQRKLGLNSSSGPWEKYQTQSKANSAKPWEKDWGQSTSPKKSDDDIHSSEEPQPAAGKAAEFDLSRTRPVLTRDEVVEIGAPNGQRIPFPKSLSAEEMRGVAGEYSDLLSAKANRERLNLIARVFTLWLTTCLIVYVFGWSVGWVYGGFRKTT